MDSKQVDFWEAFQNKLPVFNRKINMNKAIHINSKSLRDEGKIIVQLYFRETRPFIVSQISNDNIINELDKQIQYLLELTQQRNKKNNYKRLLHSISQSISKISIAREVDISKKLNVKDNLGNLGFAVLEKSILNTLKDLIPSAAFSYNQALLDLQDLQRVSFRGTANELRETLREVLDHLAPDSDVKQQVGFVLDKDQSKPTMKQKVRFILRSRGLSVTATKVPELAIEVVEERIASLARSTYERSSISSHISSQKIEVLQMKDYINSVLSELLSIHAK